MKKSSAFDPAEDCICGKGCFTNCRTYKRRTFLYESNQLRDKNWICTRWRYLASWKGYLTMKVITFITKVLLLWFRKCLFVIKYLNMKGMIRYLWNPWCWSTKYILQTNVIKNKRSLTKVKKKPPHFK